ncbi:hypothetical protein [Bacillus velezensis]|uniref:nucleotide-binding protein n=1 Tax=Bacillus velezensis TaxID=492670 RepID=UPI0039B00E1D
MRISFYGKSSVGKTFIVSNLAVGLQKRGFKVLLIGCDTKQDSSLSILKKYIPSVFDIMNQKINMELKIDDFIHEGYNRVHSLESGTPPAGIGCGGYIFGETIKMLRDFGKLESYDFYLYDVPGDLVCGGYSSPLQYSDIAYVITDNDFNSIYSLNRVVEGIYTKSKAYDVKLGGLISNRCNYVNKIELISSILNLELLGGISDNVDFREEKLGFHTVYEMFDKTKRYKEVVHEFEHIIDNILKQLSRKDKIKNPKPLEINELNERFRNQHVVQGME